jgi:ABC-type transporter Mla subunit MlaD
MPRIHSDVRQLSRLADVYADASPDLWDFVRNAISTARTLNNQQSDVDAALLASVGFGNTSADVFERGSPYLVRGLKDGVPTSQLFDEYSPEIFCTIAIITTSRRRPQQPPAATATRRYLTWSSWERPIPTSIRIICPGPTPAEVRRGGQAAGSRSPGICGLPRIW